MMLYRKARKNIRLSLCALCAVLTFSSAYIYGNDDDKVKKFLDCILHTKFPEDSPAIFAKAAIKYIYDTYNDIRIFLEDELPGFTQEEIDNLGSEEIENLKKECLKKIETEEEIYSNTQKKEYIMKKEKEGTKFSKREIAEMEVPAIKLFQVLCGKIKKIINDHFECLIKGKVPEEFNIFESDLPLYSDQKVSTQFYGTMRVRHLFKALFFVWETIKKWPDMEKFYKLPIIYLDPVEDLAALHDSNGNPSVFLTKAVDDNNKEYNASIQIGFRSFSVLSFFAKKIGDSTNDDILNSFTLDPKREFIEKHFELASELEPGTFFLFPPPLHNSIFLGNCDDKNITFGFRRSEKRNVYGPVLCLERNYPKNGDDISLRWHFMVHHHSPKKNFIKLFRQKKALKKQEAVECLQKKMFSEKKNLIPLECEQQKEQQDAPPQKSLITKEEKKEEKKEKQKKRKNKCLIF